MQLASIFPYSFYNGFKLITTKISPILQKRSMVIQKHEIASDLEDIVIPEKSLCELIFERAMKWPKHVATECIVTGRKYRYEDLIKKACNFNRQLQKKLNLKKGDVLAIILPNMPEYSLVALGCLRSGIIITAINPLYNKVDIRHRLTDSTAKVVVTLNELYAVVESAVKETNSKIPIISIKILNEQKLSEGALNFWEFLEDIDYLDEGFPSPSDTAALLFSSGTFGSPKLVQLSNKNIVATQFQLDCPKVQFIKPSTDKHQDIIPAFIPMFHAYGLNTSVFHTLLKGSKTICIPMFSKEYFIKCIKFKPAVLWTVPRTINSIASDTDIKSEYLTRLRAVICAGAPLCSKIENRFLQKVPNKSVRINHCYSLTETNTIVTILRTDLCILQSSRGSIGRPVSSTKLKIADANDPHQTPLPANVTGDLFVKGPQVMKGYYNNPKITNQAFGLDGWLKTGDRAYYNDDEIFFILDPSEELIKVNKTHITPNELETIIKTHPDVAEVAVFGVPHSKYSQVPKASVVPKPDKVIDTNELMRFVHSKIEPDKYLQGGIEVINALPKNIAGKTIKRVLISKHIKKNEKIK